MMTLTILWLRLSKCTWRWLWRKWELIILLTTIAWYIFDKFDLWWKIVLDVNFNFFCLSFVDFPRRAWSPWTEAPGEWYCAAGYLGEKYFTRGRESKKGQTCSGEESQDHGTDVCFAKSFHQRKCWITGVNGDWRVCCDEVIFDTSSEWSCRLQICLKWGCLTG